MTATALLRTVTALIALASVLAFDPASALPAQAAAYNSLAPSVGDRPSLVVPVQRGGGFRAPSYSPPPVYRAPTPAPSYRAPSYNAPSYRPSPPAYRPPTFSAPPPTFRPPPPTFRAPPTVQGPGSRPMVQRPAPVWRQGPAVSSRGLLPLSPLGAPAARVTADPRGRGPGWALTAGPRAPAGIPRVTLRPSEKPSGVAASSTIRAAGATTPRVASLGPATPRLANRPARIAVAAPVPASLGLRPAAIAPRSVAFSPPRERSAAMARLAGTRQFDAEQRLRLSVRGSPTIAEMRRGFRGQFNAAGQALVTVRGRVVAVRPSLIGVRAPTPGLANDTRAAPATQTARPASSSPPPPPPPTPPNSPPANDSTRPSGVVARTAPPLTSRSGVGGQSFVMAQGSKTPFVHRSMAGLTGATASDAKRPLILGSAQKDVVTLDRRLVRQQGMVRETGQDNVQRGSKAGATQTASRQSRGTVVPANDQPGPRTSSLHSTSSVTTARRADRLNSMIASARGSAEASRPPTNGELRRAFRGQFTADGRAIVTFRGKTIFVQPSRIGVTQTVHMASITRNEMASQARRKVTAVSSAPVVPAHRSLAQQVRQALGRGEGGADGAGKTRAAFVRVMGGSAGIVASLAAGGTVAVLSDAVGERTLREDKAVADGAADLRAKVKANAAATANSNRVGGFSVNDNVKTNAKDPAGWKKAQEAFQVAKDFYGADNLVDKRDPKSKYGDWRFKYDDTGEHRGIDFDKEVKVDKLEAGKTLCQYQVRGGRTGAFFADCNATPSELGIADMGRRWKSLGSPDNEKTYKYAVVEAKVQKRFKVTCKEVPALISTAAPVVDDWSLGYGVPTKGGAIQYTLNRNFVNDEKAFKNCFEEIA